MKLPLLLNLAILSTAYSQGVFVYKNKNFHKDADAHAFVYSSITVKDPVTWVVRGNEKIRYERTQFHHWCPVRTKLPDELANQSQIAAFRSEVESIAEFYNRFDRARPLMQDSLDSLKNALEKLEKDEVRYRGEWVSKQKYLADREREAAEERALEEIRLKRKQDEQDLIAKKAMEETERIEALRLLEDQRKETARREREALREKRLGAVEKDILNLKGEIRRVENNKAVFVENLNQLLSNP